MPGWYTRYTFSLKSCHHLQIGLQLSYSLCIMNAVFVYTAIPSHVKQFIGESRSWTWFFIPILAVGVLQLYTIKAPYVTTVWFLYYTAWAVMQKSIRSVHVWWWNETFWMNWELCEVFIWIMRYTCAIVLASMMLVESLSLCLSDLRLSHPGTWTIAFVLVASRA